MIDVALSADEWIKLNHDHSGYYRVNYSPDLWRRIINQLHIDHKARTHLLQFTNGCERLAENCAQKTVNNDSLIDRKTCIFCFFAVSCGLIL